MTQYDAVLFDNDGVLVEPPADDRHLEAARQAFADHGIEDVDVDDLAAIASGVKRADLEDVCTTHGLDAAKLWAARNDHDRRFQHADIEAGERTRYDDVAAIADLTVERGVVSNNHHETVAFVLDHFGLGEHFSTYYGREPGVEAIERKKPNPHYIERACDDLGVERGLYVGDKESDVRAAHNAGLDSVFVRRDHCRSVELSVTPTHEIETLRELPQLLNGRSD